MTTGADRGHGSTLVGLMAAVLVFGFVLTSTLVAILPAFRFESQFPVLLPFFAWVGAAGAGHLANLGRSLLKPWRDAFGYASVVPYVLVMLVTAAAPHLEVPWRLGPIAAACASFPFVRLAVRARTGLMFNPARDADAATRRGTFLVGVALMLMAYAVAGPLVSGAVFAVLVAVGLGIVGMMPHGLARASRTWRLRHWAALAWASLVVWASVLLHGTTTAFRSPWAVLAAVLLAGLPLLLLDVLEGRNPARTGNTIGS